MTSDTFLAIMIAVLFVAYMAIGLYMASISSKKPKLSKLPKTAYHQDLGRAGDSQRRYTPKRNWNRIINRIVGGEVKAFHPGAVITQQKMIPDCSFYQGLISWDLMRSKTDAIILRAGQNRWVDSMFRVNYAAAKMRGMLRGVYVFWDDRVSAGDHLAMLKEALGSDVPELEIWVDWENTYNGAFKGLKNVVAFMEAIEREYPACQVGMYTGYWWFVENSNALTNWSHYQYLRSKPLWLASYTSAEAVRIPAPWTDLDFWQFGTPTYQWGQSSAEIDMSYWNGTTEEFYNRYAGDTPPPPEPGETENPMLYGTVTATATLQIRSGPGTSYSDIGDLHYGDKVEASDNLGGWWKLTKVRGVEVTTPSYASAGGGAYIRTDAAPEPPVSQVYLPDYIVAHFPNGQEKRYIPG